MKAYLSILLLGACGASGRLLSTGSSVAERPSNAPAARPAPPSESPSGSSGNTSQQRLELRFAWQKAMPARVADVIYKLRHVDAETTTISSALDLEASIGSLDELAESCHTKFSGKRIAGIADHDQPSVVCPLVARRTEVARNAMELAGRAHVARTVATTKEQVAKLASTKRLSESQLENLLAIGNDPSAKISALRKELAPLYQKLGTEVPADLLGVITTLKPDIAAAYEAAADKTIMPAATGKDAAAQKQVRAFFAADKKLRVLDVRVMSRDWTVILHQNQVPNYRRKETFALVRLPEERHCRLYPMEVRQTYAGGGKWKPGIGTYHIDASSGPYVAKCKN